MGTNIPKINLGGQYQHTTHMDQMLPLPAQTPYGNLCLKWMKITSRFIRLNRLIEAAYNLHSQALNLTRPVFPSPIEEHFFVLEEIVYWLRKSADELIGLSFLCEACIRGNKIPAKVDIDCIAELLNGGHPALQNQYKSHLSHLRQLNDISNAFKHSFINSDINFMGRDEPVLYVLSLQRNDLKKKETLVSVPLGSVIRDFDVFFQAAKSYLQKWPVSS